MEALTDPERMVNRAAYELQRAQLEKDHPGEYVVVRKGELFLGATDLQALASARERHPDGTINSGLLIKIGQPEQAWLLHTPGRI